MNIIRFIVNYSCCKQPRLNFHCETDVGGVLVSTVGVKFNSRGRTVIWSTVVFDDLQTFDELTHSEDDARAMHAEAVTYARQANEVLEIFKAGGLS